MARRLNVEVVSKVGWYPFLRMVPGIGRKGISVVLGIVRVSSSSIAGLGIFHHQACVVQVNRVENIFYLRVRW